MPSPRSRFRMLALATWLAALAAQASAGELNLRWNACWGDGGVANRSFACDVNTGSEQLVVSFLPPFTVTGVVGLQGVVRLAFAGSSVPPWWRFGGAGACRPGALSTRFAAPVGTVACADWSDGSASGLTAYVPDPFGAAMAQIQPVAQLPAGSSVVLSYAQEYFAFTFVITHAKTVGTGACAGCDLGACLGASRLLLVRANSADNVTLSPSNNADQQVTWQGGLGLGQSYCPGVTAARRTAWGSVKALYR